MINLKAQLDKLIELQKIDAQIHALRLEKDIKPQEIKMLEASFEEKKQALLDLEKESLEIQKRKKEIELELAAKEESIKKLQAQLYSLKTNKEYQAMLTQIGDAKADVSVIEDKILGCLDQSDQLRVRVEEEKKKLQLEENEFKTKKKSVEDRVKQIDENLAQLDSSRKQASEGIDKKMLEQYQRILENKDGLAIVSVVNNSCGGCNMFVPPQVINLIKMYENIITCEMCNRILYIEES